MLKFVFKNVVIFGCITMSQGRSYMTAMKARVTSERPFFNFSEGRLFACRF